MVEFDPVTTLVAFLAVIAVGIGGLVAMGFMALQTTLMMVAPSMAVFGVICLAIGVKFGEYRATQ
ncbi:DUF7333 family protein [Salinarchaeum laminariae]|uniref:DUF7333 family protein n=1 Tax=Salinarchaeum laminariae TaxID=869888 RepID=UPI0020BFBB26|nr:hypothetical protein [Salinarchaeum laminariae]